MKNFMNENVNIYIVTIETSPTPTNFGPPAKNWNILVREDNSRRLAGNTRSKYAQLSFEDIMKAPQRNGPPSVEAVEL
jgi:hypothetical protein